MEKLTLISPNLSFSDEIRAYRQEFLDLGSPLNGCGPLADMEDPAQWVVHTQRFELGEDIPEGMGPSTQFIYVRESDQKILGTIQIRHTFTPFLETYGGHIGYSIRPSERQKGYATKMLHDCLPYCRSLGLDRVLVCCMDTNTASRKTILANGGIYDGTVYEPEGQVNFERYWITVNEGSR